MEERRTTERRIEPMGGFPPLILGILLVGAAVAFVVMCALQANGWYAVPAVVFLLAAIFAFLGLIIVNPNQSRVLILFGRYSGSAVEQGYFWVNPFTVRRKVSLRVNNFNSDTLKVNDSLGNPVEIAAVVVWRVENTAQAIFDVEDHFSYVAVQSEAAVRHLASRHPYDSTGEAETSLRGSSDVVNEELKQELAERLELAGIEVLEARLSHLAYAPEIAGAMLQRQQAEAIIAARTRIVDGAVGMVRMALEHLEQGGIVDLDEERKASMVSNLLVVLCSERGTQPVLNTGTLYP